jgi:Ca-activated chloride channel family protein
MAARANAKVIRSLFWALAITAIAAVHGQQPLFRTGVDVVRIDVSVMNGLSPVGGLTRDQFVVLDNGVPQTVDSATLETVPLSLTLVLDTSASMRDERIDHLIEGSQALIKALHPQDEAALLTFSEHVHLAVGMTRDHKSLLDALGHLEANGATALNDAVFLGLQLRALTASDSRPVLLVFSDGHDTASWLRHEQLLDATRRSNLLLHVIELLPPAFGPTVAQRPSETLKELAKAGGGRHWAALKASDLNDLFGKALNELRARYLLTYSPAGVTREGWHDVKVTVKGARGDVTARPGYFVAPQ